MGVTQLQASAEDPSSPDPQAPAPALGSLQPMPPLSQTGHNAGSSQGHTTVASSAHSDQTSLRWEGLQRPC